MYDDAPPYDPFLAYDPDPTDTAVHLCPECRDLMADVVRAAARAPQPPPVPEWQRALDWLAAQCGGHAAVEALDDAPLTGAGLELPAELGVDERRRLESVDTLLDATARRFFDDEAGAAFRRALLRLFERQPALVTGARSASQLALGVVWAVGHANGLLYPLGAVREKDLKAYLNATQGGSTLGDRVRSALRGPYAWEIPDRPWRWRSGSSSRDLAPLGHLDLLTSTLRRQLLTVRDRAYAERDAARAVALSAG